MPQVAASRWSASNRSTLKQSVSSHFSRSTTPKQRGFTLPEVLVVAGVIALLIAVLLPALSGGLSTANMAKSQNRLRQIFTWMQAYSGENREFIVPSQFNYQDALDPNSPAGNFAVKVGSDEGRPAGWRYRGTWADILWTENGLGKDQALIDPAQAANLDKYQYQAPDKAVFAGNSTYDESPFRSSVANGADFYPTAGTPGTGARPYGTGATEAGLPGFFAANNFFNQDPLVANLPAGWWVTGQIKSPDRSMYLVDSFAGEIINPNDDAGQAATLGDPYNNAVAPPGQPKAIEVDFRYNGSCLMMFLDGHNEPQSPWDDLDELETSRKIKVRNLAQSW